MFIPKPVWLAFALLLLSTNMTHAQGRQFYSKYWQKEGGYYYKNYYYKTTPNAKSYRYHRVIYYPSRPRYYYYYNPYSGKYWGRWDCSARGYSRLKPADQRGRITAIDEDAFPNPGAMPMIPESNDNVAMLPPQENLGDDPASSLRLPLDESK